MNEELPHAFRIHPRSVFGAKPVKDVAERMLNTADSNANGSIDLACEASCKGSEMSSRDMRHVKLRRRRIIVSVVFLCVVGGVMTVVMGRSSVVSTAATSAAGTPRIPGSSTTIAEVGDLVRERADTNGDGLIDLSGEAAGGSQKLAPADQDQDGLVNSDELSNYLTRFDTDDDGNLSRRELVRLRNG